MLFATKRVKTLRLDNLAITCGVNVFADCVKDQLAHLVAQFTVLASISGDQYKVALLGFEQRCREIKSSLREFARFFLSESQNQIRISQQF